MSLLEVFEETIGDYEPTSTDLDGWTELEPSAIADTDTEITTTVGLFGADLTDFEANCAAATGDCDPEDYVDFSGWAIGIKWTAGTAPAPANPCVTAPPTDCVCYPAAPGCPGAATLRQAPAA